MGQKHVVRLSDLIRTGRTLKAGVVNAGLHPAMNHTLHSHDTAPTQLPHPRYPKLALSEPRLKALLRPEPALPAGSCGGL